MKPILAALAVLAALAAPPAGAQRVTVIDPLGDDSAIVRKPRHERPVYPRARGWEPPVDAERGASLVPRMWNDYSPPPRQTRPVHPAHPGPGFGYGSRPGYGYGSGPGYGHGYGSGYGHPPLGGGSVVIIDRGGGAAWRR